MTSRKERTALHRLINHCVIDRTRVYGTKVLYACGTLVPLTQLEAAD